MNFVYIFFIYLLFSEFCSFNSDGWMDDWASIHSNLVVFNIHVMYWAYLVFNMLDN